MWGAEQRERNEGGGAPAVSGPSCLRPQRVVSLGELLSGCDCETQESAISMSPVNPQIRQQK